MMAYYDEKQGMMWDDPSIANTEMFGGTSLCLQLPGGWSFLGQENMIVWIGDNPQNHQKSQAVRKFIDSIFKCGKIVSPSFAWVVWGRGATGLLVTAHSSQRHFHLGFGKHSSKEPLKKHSRCVIPCWESLGEATSPGYQQGLTTQWLSLGP